MYSVRWYFEGEEFYRYVPKESPPARVFPVLGITVDVSFIKKFIRIIFVCAQSDVHENRTVMDGFHAFDTGSNPVNSINKQLPSNSYSVPFQSFNFPLLFLQSSRSFNDSSSQHYLNPTSPTSPTIPERFPGQRLMRVILCGS